MQKKLILSTTAALAALGIAAAPAGASIKAPKLKNGTLTVNGTNDADTLALRLKAGDPATLQVDDGTAVFSFAKAQVSKISVDALAGDDTVRIDESNGA